MTGADQNRVAHGVRDQIYAAHQERAQKDVSQHCVKLHDAPQIDPIYFEKCARFGSAGSNQTTAAGQMNDFAGEFSAADDTDDGFGRVRNTDNFDAPLEYDKDAVAGVSQVEKNFAGLRAPLQRAYCKTRDLRIVQLGEHCVKLFGGFRHHYSRII